MSKIKIVEVGLSYERGGIESFLMNYFKNIDQSKFDITFINVFEEAKEEQFYKELSKYGKIVKLSNYRNHPIKFIKEFKKLNKIENFDIFHYNMNSASYLVPLIAAKKSNIKTIISHSHNTSSDKGIIKTLLHNINKHFIPLYANSFFACSEEAGKWFFKDKILKSDAFCVVKNAIDTKKFLFNEEIRERIRKELNVDKDTIVIGHVGRFSRQKNQVFLVEIFNEYKKENQNSVLVLVGYGDEYGAKIQNKIKELGIKDSVRILGERNDVNCLMQGFDAFVFPSLYEGLGMVLVEAQSSGLPCLTTDDIPEIAVISNEFYRCSLKKSAQFWANQLLKINVRVNRNVEDNSYNITNATKKLEEIFINLRKENSNG